MPNGLPGGPCGGGGACGSNFRRQKHRQLVLDGKVYGTEDLPAFSVPDEFAVAKPAEPEAAAAQGDEKAAAAAVEAGSGPGAEKSCASGSTSTTTAPGAASGAAEAEAEEARGEDGSLMTLESLKGHWYRNGDPLHCWTIKDKGGSYFNGRYAGVSYDFKQERDVIYADAHRSNGEELDLRKSTAERLVWVTIEDQSFSATWTRAPEAASVPQGTVLSACAAEFVPGLSASAAEFVPGRADQAMVADAKDRGGEGLWDPETAAEYWVAHTGGASCGAEPPSHSRGCPLSPCKGFGKGDDQAAWKHHNNGGAKAGRNGKGGGPQAMAARGDARGPGARAPATRSAEA